MEPHVSTNFQPYKSSMAPEDRQKSEAQSEAPAVRQRLDEKGRLSLPGPLLELKSHGITMESLDFELIKAGWFV